MSANYQDNVGKRVLIEWGIRGMIEVKILEVAPSGNHAKIQSANHTEWIQCWRHDIIENLPEQSP